MLGSGGSEPDGEAIEPQEVTIVAVDYAYPEAPTELEAGVIELDFENRGTVAHEVSLAEIGDTPLDRFVEDLRGGAFSLSGNPNPDYLDQVAVPIFGLAGGATDDATFTLTEFNYALFCIIPAAAEGDEEAPHYEKGMLRELRVTGGNPAPELPEAEGTITAVDYSFRFDLDAGDRVVNFINRGPTRSTTPRSRCTRRAWMRRRRRRPTLLSSSLAPTSRACPRRRASDGAASSAQGLEARSVYTYAFACFAPDREGGEPHAIAYDMVEVVTIE